MLNLLAEFRDISIFFNLFRYITFRSGGGMMTALTLSFIIGPFVIYWMAIHQSGKKTVREDVPDTHLRKIGTPTMGGIMILAVLFCAILLWADLTDIYSWIILWILVSFGLLGFYDDYQKLARGKGIKVRYKMVLQILFALIGILIYINTSPNPEVTSLAIPFVKNVSVPLGIFYIPFAIFVVVGASNAVNLTDGLDGLAIVPMMIAAASLAFIAYLSGNRIYADYLGISYIAGSEELVIICAAMIGAGLGFLWFNAPPAKIFMGDTGSLSLGGALGMISIITRHEIVFAIIGGVFVLETVSVIVQVVSFKLTGRRVFAMAPLHHHFEKRGWSESTIVIRFWIISIIMAMIGLASLKLR